MDIFKINDTVVMNRNIKDVMKLLFEEINNSK